MHPDIRKLLEIQKVDQQLARLRRDLDSLPAEETKRRARLDKVRQGRQQASDELKHAEVESRSQETSIQGADQEIKKLQGRLNTVKNNAEYQATLFQIESVKRERSAIEDEGVQLLEKLDELRARVGQLDAQLAEEEATFARFQEEASALRADRETKLANAGRGRDDLLKDVPADLLEKYQSIFHVRDGVAVCPVEGQVCTGCYTSVTHNDMARLMGATSIVQCGACQRILYLAEV